MQSESMLPEKDKNSFYHYQIIESNVVTDDGKKLGKGNTNYRDWE